MKVGLVVAVVLARMVCVAMSVKPCATAASSEVHGSRSATVTSTSVFVLTKADTATAAAWNPTPNATCIPRIEAVRVTPESVNAYWVYFFAPCGALMFVLAMAQRERRSESFSLWCLLACCV